MHIGLNVKYPLFVSNFNKTWIFSTDFSNNIQISNLIKIRPVEAESFHMDEQTEERDEAKKCANEPKNQSLNDI